MRRASCSRAARPGVAGRLLPTSLSPRRIDMSELKDMYRTIVADGFPDTMTITLGASVLT